MDSFWGNSVDTLLTSLRVYISQGYKSCCYAKRLQIQMNDKKFMFAAPWDVNNVDSLNGCGHDVKHVKTILCSFSKCFSKNFPHEQVFVSTRIQKNA